MLSFAEIKTKLERYCKDQHGADNRGKKRYVRIAMNIIASILGRGLGVVVSFISVGLTSHFLDMVTLGVFMTISSFGIYLTFADLGIGNGLMNAIATAHGRDDRKAMHAAISTAFFSLSGIAFVIFGVGCLLSFLLKIGPSIFNVYDQAHFQDVNLAVFVYFAIFSINLLFSSSERVRIGQQTGYLNQVYVIIGNILSLIFLMIATRSHAPLPWLVVANETGPVCGRILNFIMLFFRQQPDLRPKFSLVDRHRVRSLMGTALFFFLLQASVPFMTAFDKLLFSHLFGAEAVPSYTVPLRLFEVIGGVCGIALVPFWPAYAEAIARRDVAWIRVTLKRLISVTMGVMGGAALFLTLAGNTIIHHWAGDQYSAPWTLLLGLGSAALATSFHSVCSIFLNAMNKLKIQVFLVWSGILLTLVIKVIIGEMFGIVPFVWANVAGITFLMLAPLAVYTLWIFRRLDSVADQHHETPL